MFLAYIHRIAYQNIFISMTFVMHVRVFAKYLAATFTIALITTGCAQISTLDLAGAAIGKVLDVAGISKKESVDLEKSVSSVTIKLFAGSQLNQASNGKPLSLVVKLYVLRSPEKLSALNYQQPSSNDGDKEAFGEDLLSVREIILLPGKSYVAAIKVPGNATTIGVVGLFRAPYKSRWKLAFSSKQSDDESITIGAHACALSASKGALIDEISPESVRSLVGVQCNA